MKKKTAIEMERDKIVKVTRSLVRLKHSLAADEELNESLSDILDKFDTALQKGELLQINPKVQEILGDI